MAFILLLLTLMTLDMMSILKVSSVKAMDMEVEAEADGLVGTVTVKLNESDEGLAFVWT